MNVWIRITRRQVICRHCEKMIETGEYQVVCRYFMKLKHSERTWTKQMHFHIEEPNCWLERAKTELATRTYVERRGRKADCISDERKVLRQKILRRRASVMQRIGIEMENGGRPAKLIRLTALLEALAAEIKPYGGVPESWK